jgi:DNA primase
VNYRGRNLDPVSLWGEIVDFPQDANFSGEFAPLVRCPNPDHATDKRHFQINLEKPLVHCFAACGISGTYEKAIAIAKGISEKEARKVILQHTRVGLGPTSKRKVRGADGRVRRASGGTENHVSPPSLEYDTYIPQLGLEYLDSRGIDASSIASFSLGWDADDRRIVIPADDERGVRRFLIKRAVRSKDWPKYLYWPEKEACGWGKTDLLFGACKLDLKQVSSDGLVLCEGSLDAIRLHQSGIQATAILGTGLSVQQANIISKLRPRRVFFMFDRDGAGAKNVMMAAARLTKVPVFVCLYPKGKSDPAELTKKEAERAIDTALSMVAFKRRLRERGIDLTSPKRRKEKAYG